MKQDQKKKPKKSPDQTFDRKAITWQSPEPKDTLNQIDENQKRNLIEIAYQYYSSREFVSKTISDHLQGIKPHADSAEILKKLRDSSDWVGELLKIVMRGLRRFRKVHKQKWNADKQLLFFLFFIRVAKNNPNMLREIPSKPADLLTQLGIEPYLFSLDEDEAVKAVNAFLDLMSLAIEKNTKRISKLKDKELRQAVKRKEAEDGVKTFRAMKGQEEENERKLQQALASAGSKSANATPVKTEKQKFIQKIKSARREAEKQGERISVSAIVKHLNPTEPYTTFTDHMKKHNITFDKNKKMFTDTNTGEQF